MTAASGFFPVLRRTLIGSYRGRDAQIQGAGAASDDKSAENPSECRPSEILGRFLAPDGFQLYFFLIDAG